MQKPPRHTTNVSLISHVMQLIEPLLLLLRPPTRIVFITKVSNDRRVILMLHPLLPGHNPPASPRLTHK